MLDIVQVMPFLQIDLPMFRFTELGSKSAILLKINIHNFYNCQKEYVLAFYNTILYRYFIALREIYQDVCPEVPGNPQDVIFPDADGEGETMK